MSSVSHSVDVVIVGSGFAGSLTAAILSQHRFRVALIDKARHPRFAIGESSTPTANLILRELSQQHDLPQLLPLCRFGSWRQTYPQVLCGLKRGFSYFQHVAGEEFRSDHSHANELLVAASASDHVSDTQWLRSDVDAFLFRLAQAVGALTFEETNVLAVHGEPGDWLIATDRKTIRCGFIIDGTGQLQSELAPLGLAQPSRLAVDGKRMEVGHAASNLRTNSRTIFGHFRNLPRWEATLLARSPTAARDFPFRCDDAALHHVLDEGWMWWIRFANDVTSVGLVLDGQRCPLDPVRTPAEEWQQILGRYPSLSPLLSGAHLIAPAGGLVRTGRLQRRAAQCVGAGWALLPHTAGFIDPLHSTGIAYSLAGVDRLTSALIAGQTSPNARDSALVAYERSLHAELDLVDQFVSGAYAAIAARSFRKFVAFAMTYFAAATTWEHRRLAQPAGPAPMLFLADDESFTRVVSELSADLMSSSDSEFERHCAQRLEPFNRVGLFTPPIPNMYGGTAVPES